MSDDERTPPPLLSRLLFGGAIGFAAGSNFQNMEEMIEYAESKDIPMADLLVPFASGMATVGALGVTLWRLPTLSAGAVATFLAGITPTMHDFWNMEGERREQEQVNFVKNVALFAASLAFIQRARSLSSSDDSSGGGSGGSDPDGDDEGGLVEVDLGDDGTTDADDDSGIEALTPE